MANIVAKLETTQKTLKQLHSGARRVAFNLLSARAAASAANISKAVGNMLVGVLDSTDIIQSLRGTGSEDLPAHLGLSDSTASSLADGMGEIIKNSVTVIGTRANNSLVIKIQAVSRDWDNYLSLPGARYLSQPSNIEIPVVEWMLVNPNIDIGQAAYDIVFSGDISGLDTRIQQSSRSGRAIMVSLEKLGGGNGYVLPSIISGYAGENFIELALGQPNIAKKALDILIANIT